MTYPAHLTTWVALDPQFKDRALWWRCLWLANLTKLRTGRLSDDNTAAYLSLDHARALYLSRGGTWTQYIPRRQRRKAAR